MYLAVFISFSKPFHQLNDIIKIYIRKNIYNYKELKFRWTLR